MGYQSLFLTKLIQPELYLINGVVKIQIYCEIEIVFKPLPKSLKYRILALSLQ